MKVADPKAVADADSRKVEIVVRLFSMLAEPTRVHIILALNDAEKAVNELVEITGKPQTVVSQHLAKLRLSGIVTSRQDGNRSLYSLTDEHVISIVKNAFFQVEHLVEESPRHHARSDRRS